MKTTQLSMLFGRKQVHATVPTKSLLGVLEPRPHQGDTDEEELIKAALDRPIGTKPLTELVRPGQKVVIVTSDLTRPCPSERLLPPILEQLSGAGIGDEDVTIVIALGLHRPMTPAELELAVGPQICRRLRVINHDPEDTVHLGTTQAGTPVEIFRPVVEADLRLCLGNLELHYFAGFSGGAKAILPGCASQAAITANHGMMVRQTAVAGRLEGNPVRADLEEGVAMLGVDFILNVMVDGHKRIIAAVAGDVELAHRQGCRQVAAAETVPISERADVVVLSAGGYPKDLNLYQAQKALDNAAGAVKEGGIIVWASQCLEGLGNQTFEAWLCQAHTPQEVVKRIQREFVLGGHKAAAIAAVLCRARIYLVSDLPAETVKACGMVPFADFDQAVQRALAEVGKTPKVLALPFGGSVLPVLS